MINDTEKAQPVRKSSFKTGLSTVVDSESNARQFGAVNVALRSSGFQFGFMNDATLNSDEDQFGLFNFAGAKSRGSQTGILNLAGSFNIYEHALDMPTDYSGKQFGVICFVNDGECRQFGLLTIRCNGPWYKRVSPLYGHSRKREDLDFQTELL